MNLTAHLFRHYDDILPLGDQGAAAYELDDQDNVKQDANISLWLIWYVQNLCEYCRQVESDAWNELD